MNRSSSSSGAVTRGCCATVAVVSVAVAAAAGAWVVQGFSWNEYRPSGKRSFLWVERNQRPLSTTTSSALVWKEVAARSWNTAKVTTRISSRRKRTTGTSLPATTYFPSDWTDEENADENGDNRDASASTAAAAMIPEILSTKEWTAPLARLAAGHWDGGGLRMEHIEQVSVRAVAPSHVDIEAIVCEAEGCVSLSVPVPFAQPCDSIGGSFGAKFEECILRNIQLLDDAQIQHAMNADGEDVDALLTEEEFAALRSSDNVEVPSWWQYPKTMAFARECDTLMNILNEPDFQTDLLALVKHEMRVLLENDDDGIELQRTAVAAVGPAGIALRAYALYNGDVEMVPVPVAFAEPVTDVTKMRDAVLDCVESVSSQQ